jgi:hypothetical protein
MVERLPDGKGLVLRVGTLVNVDVVGSGTGVLGP